MRPLGVHLESELVYSDPVLPIRDRDRLCDAAFIDTLIEADRRF